jgi:DNA-binding transcriptional ArsR family regulator
MSPVKRKSSAQSSQNLARVFAALGDPTRLKLVAVLCSGGALSSSQLTANTYISRQAVTKHLQVLSDAGVTRDMKAGRERLWQLEPARIEDAKRSLEVIGQQWEAALGKLKAFAEAT